MLTARQEDWFLEINPNGRVSDTFPLSFSSIAFSYTKIDPQIPALTDKSSDGSTIRLFESGSIMQYLVDKYDPDHKVSYPFGSKEYYETNNWVSLSRSEESLGQSC